MVKSKFLTGYLASTSDLTPIMSERATAFREILKALSFFLKVSLQIVRSGLGLKIRAAILVHLTQSPHPLQSLFATPWTATRQASLTFAISWSLLKLMPIESMMPSNRLILRHPLLLASIFPSIRVFSNELALRIRWPQYWSFSFQ